MSTFREREAILRREDALDEGLGFHLALRGLSLISIAMEDTANSALCQN